MPGRTLLRNPPNDNADVAKSPSRLREGSGEGLFDAAPSHDDNRSPGPTRKREGGKEHVPERTCILTREAAPRAGLIRLALGPDGSVAPDIRARAPGRGAWVGVDRAALEAAQAKGKLKAALARAFKTGAVTVPDDLGERIEAALRQAVLDRLGLEAKAGNLVTGGEKIDAALRRGEVHLLIHASDAGADGRGKLDQALRVGSDGEDRQGLVFPADRAILSLALGRQNVVHVAILDRAAAARVRDLLGRWAAFIGRDAEVGAASAASAASANLLAAEGHEGQE